MICLDFIQILGHMYSKILSLRISLFSEYELQITCETTFPQKTHFKDNLLTTTTDLEMLHNICHTSCTTLRLNLLK